MHYGTKFSPKKFIAPKSETKKVSFDEENQRFNFD
jgi:hypothetical protein